MRHISKGRRKVPSKKNFSHEKSTGQVSWAGSLRQYQQTLPISPANFTVGCAGKSLSPDTWALWSVAALSRESSNCPGSTPEARNTWVARAGFPRNSIERGWAGVTEGKINEGPLVVCDCEQSFAGDRVTDGAGLVEPQLPVLTKVSLLLDALKMGGSYEFFKKLWSQILLTAGRVNTEVAWTCDEVLVGFLKFTESLRLILGVHCFFLLSVDHFNWNAALNSVICVAGWNQAHHLYSLEFEERDPTLWTFIRKWEKDTFRRVAVIVSDRFSCDAAHELSVLGSVVVAVGGSASLVAVSGGSRVLADTYGDYLGSGYDRKLVITRHLIWGS